MNTYGGLRSEGVYSGKDLSYVMCERSLRGAPLLERYPCSGNERSNLNG